MADITKNQEFTKNLHNAPLAPEAVETKKTVTMVFEKKIVLTLNDLRRVEFPAGIQEVPEELVSHPWLKAHGVKKYEPVAKEEKKPATVQATEKHLEFLQSRGYCKDGSSVNAQKFIDNLASDDLVGFLQDFAEFVSAPAAPATSTNEGKEPASGEGEESGKKEKKNAAGKGK